MIDKKNFLTKGWILSIQDKKIEEVFVPQWGGIVRVRSLSSEEVQEIYDFLAKQNGKISKDFKARVISMAICDELGKRIFEDGDIKGLAERDAESVKLVFEVAQRLMGIGEKKVADSGGILPGSEVKS